jgi:UDP-N-acetylglucosamine--N-acetylmuramyl-(pentapeptide) pyrophosphoryl-undecaprenol N-acetylglucosamine transferase
MRCVIAGGGTGGHLFPGIAVAEAFMEREGGNEVLFIGTERGIEASLLKGGSFPLKMIQAKPIKGRAPLGKLKALWSLPVAVSEAFSILKSFRPQIVLGVGGYASGPTLVAAFLLGVRRAIHEQNMVPGMTNRILKWFSQRIFVSFEESKKYFPEKRTFVTGNPIRKEILNCLPRTSTIKGLSAFKPTGSQNEFSGRQEALTKDRFTLLIFGGSAGAHRINETVIWALDSMKEVRSSMRFIHQTGKDDLDFVSRAYQERGLDAVVKAFFEDMATRYRMADLVICRSGASTLSELAVCGKPAIFIPYPFAAHHHQRMNAQRLVKLGAARMIEDRALTGPALAEMILHLYAHPEERMEMEEKIRQMGKPRAAEEIVDHCYAMVHGVYTVH